MTDVLGELRGVGRRRRGRTPGGRRRRADPAGRPRRRQAGAARAPRSTTASTPARPTCSPPRLAAARAGAARRVAAARVGRLLLPGQLGARRRRPRTAPRRRGGPRRGSGTPPARCDPGRTCCPAATQMHAFEDAAWAPYETTSLMLASLSRRRTPPRRAGRRGHRGHRLDEGWLATDERAARFGDAARAVIEAGDGHPGDRPRRGRVGCWPGAAARSTATGAASPGSGRARTVAARASPRPCWPRCWSAAPRRARRRPTSRWWSPTGPPVGSTRRSAGPSTTATSTSPLLRAAAS